MPAINLVAVVAATVAAMIIGGIYYTPAVMGNRMMALLKTPMIHRTPSAAVAMQVVFSLVQMVVLAWLIYIAGAKGFAAGATIGFAVWILLAIADAGQTTFSGRPWPLWLLNQVNWVITLVVAGAVIGALSS